MAARRPNLDTDELRRLQLHKTSEKKAGAAPLGRELVDFFQKSIARRQTRLMRLAECWTQLVPPTLADHCSLEGLNRGVLTVIVDSSPHLYELKQLLLSGLERQIKLAGASTGLHRIALRRGRWYDGDDERDRRVRFGGEPTTGK